MVEPHRSFLFGARGRLLSFNLLAMSLALFIGLVAYYGFTNAGRLLREMQENTLSEMNSGMEVGVKTAKVATFAISLTQVVGAMEYQSESDRLKLALKAQKASIDEMAVSPLASRQPALIAQIQQRASELQQSVQQLLDTTRARHLDRHNLLSLLYQAQSQLDLIGSMPADHWPSRGDQARLNTLITMALPIPASPVVLEQLAAERNDWQWLAQRADNERRPYLLQLTEILKPVHALDQTLKDRDLAIAYHTFRVRALVGMLDASISQYVQLVADSASQRATHTQRELSASTGTVEVFALLALFITGLAGRYIYLNLGVHLTAIADAMTRLAQGERTVHVPALKRKDELGDLARAFNVFAQNAAALEKVTRLLREKSGQLETTFLSIRDGFALFAADGTLVVSNPQYGQLLQIGDIAPGSHFNDVLARLRTHPTLHDEPEIRAFGDHHDLAQSIELALPGEQFVELHLTRLPNQGIASMVLDRTMRKSLETKLIHDQKMKAVGHLTGGIAHDFNNLLAVILGNLDLLQESGLGERTRVRIERAHKAAERGALLIQRLLAFSRKQALRPQAVDLELLVANLRELMEHSLPDSLQLTYEAAPHLRRAWIDANQLENCLMNLVVNARDAMEGRHGRISLRLFNQTVARSGGIIEEMVSIEVMDQGCGMTPELAARVFEPFFTTKPAGKGSGLGLSMVYGFIRQSGGRVQIESEPGRGTCIRLQLPWASQEPQLVVIDTPPHTPSQPLVHGDASQRESEPPQVAGEPPLIVVLEDQADVRQTLCDYLHNLGFITLDSASAADVIGWVQQLESVHLLISDIALPGQMSGIDVANLAREQRPALPVLLVSGHDFSEQAARLHYPLLMKPYDQNDLLCQINQLLAQEVSPA